MNCVLSFVVPCFNCEKTVETVFESIIGQTGLPSYEIIFVDDGSTDSTMKVLQSLKSKNGYLNIKLYQERNSGPGTARNLGLKHATGDYVLFVDSDDLLDPKYANKLCEGIVGYDFAFSSYFRKTNLSKTEIVKSSLPQSDRGSDLLSFFICGFAKISLWNSIFLKKIIDQYRICFKDNLFVGEDVLFIMDYLVVCSNWNYIDEALYTYFFDSKKSKERITNKYVTSMDKTIYWPLYKRIKSDGIENCVNAFERSKFPLVSVNQLRTMCNKASSFKDFKKKLFEASDLFFWLKMADKDFMKKKQYRRTKQILFLAKRIPLLFYFLIKRCDK